MMPGALVCGFFYLAGMPKSAMAAHQLQRNLSSGQGKSNSGREDS
jgi:hypothetical protein